MPVVNLTARFVVTLKPPPTGQVDYRDDGVPGFGLRVSAGGRKSWVVVYRQGGRLRRLTLGVYPHLELAAARAKARDALHEVGQGGDPARTKQEDRRAETFADLAREYIERHAKRKKSGDEDIRILNGSPQKKRTGKTPHVPLVSRWGSRKIKDIRRADVRELLDEIGARAPIMANRVLALVRRMFNFAIERDWLEANPCQMVKAPGEERQRDRVLSEDELRRVWLALDNESPLVATLFRLRILTAQRGGEVHGASWAEFDLATGWWTIPAERAKNRLAHRVPLGPQALGLLKTWQAQVDDSPWVFPSSRKKGPHIAHAQKAIERLVRASGVKFRGHDLRRTAASLMVGGGVPRLVVSKILNHVETGVTAVYDRHGYDFEKRAALEVWDSRLAAIVEPCMPSGSCASEHAADSPRVPGIGAPSRRFEIANDRALVSHLGR
jgi:integrase